MADVSPQLKRKSEEAVALRKTKKQRKNESVTSSGAEVTSAPKSNATSAPPSQPKTASKPAQANGASQHAPADDPATLLADKAGDVVEAPRSSVEASSKESRKQAKRDRKAAVVGDTDAQPKDNSNEQSTAIEPLTQEQVEKALKKQERKERMAANQAHSSNVSRFAKTKKQKSKGMAQWTSSPAQGGWFLPSDPIFSPDEKYLILANLKSLQIHATETSLLANVLPLGGAGVLTAYALSTTRPNQVYVADSTGLITLWDWVSGTKVGRWDIGASVRNMTVITQSESNEDLIYCHEFGKNHVINVHALRTKSQSSKTELKRVLKTNSAIHGIQVLLQGKYAILATSDSIMVGKRLKLNKTAVQDFEYVWREIKFSKRITTFSAIVREPEASAKGKKSAQDKRDVLDIAVGEDSGVIFLFEDILATFAAIESSQKAKKDNADSAESLRPKRLHWHREAVGALKWSLDGE